MGRSRKMLYKVLSLSDKMLKTLFGILNLHTIYPAKSQLQGHGFPEKESPFYYFSCFVYNQYISWSSRPKSSSGPG